MDERLKLSSGKVSELFNLISRSKNSWSNFANAQDNVINCENQPCYRCPEKECTLRAIAKREGERMESDESVLASFARENAVELAATLGLHRTNVALF